MRRGRSPLAETETLTKLVGTGPMVALSKRFASPLKRLAGRLATVRLIRASHIFDAVTAAASVADMVRVPPEQQSLHKRPTDGGFAARR